MPPIISVYVVASVEDYGHSLLVALLLLSLEVKTVRLARGFQGLMFAPFQENILK
jgi:hypothetical protein